MELAALQAALTDFQALETSLVTISPQRPEHSRALADRRHLTFPILSDRGNAVARRFGVVFTLPEYLREIYLAFPLDLAQYNEAEPWTLPMPGRFVIDRAGIVRDVEVDPDYTTRPDPAATLAAVRKVAAG